MPVVTGGQPLYQNILNVATVSRTATHGPNDPLELTNVGIEQGDPNDDEEPTKTAAELHDPNDPQESSRARVCESRSLHDLEEPTNDGAESVYQNITETLTAAAGKGFLLPKTNTNRYKASFLPSSLSVFNEKYNRH